MTGYMHFLGFGPKVMKINKNENTIFFFFHLAFETPSEDDIKKLSSGSCSYFLLSGGSEF